MLAQANLTTIEIHRVHERLMEHVVGIENASLWLRQAQDGDLRRTLQSHLNMFQNHFQKLFSFLGGQPAWGGAPGASGPQPGTMGGPWSQPGGSPPGNGGGWAWTPQTSGFAGQYGYRPTEPTQAFQADPSDTRITDPVLAASCLVFCKFESLACAQGAVEVGHLPLRQALLEMSRDHSQMALELYQLMERKGWYPVQIGPDSALMDQARAAYQGALRRTPTFVG